MASMDQARRNYAASVDRSKAVRAAGIAEARMERTRMALGSQIRVALDHMVGRGLIVGWKVEASEGDGHLTYVLEDDRMFCSYSPGNCAEMLRTCGYDVRIGSGTGEQVEA